MKSPDELRSLLHEWHEVPAPDPNLAARIVADATGSPVSDSRWSRSLAWLAEWTHALRVPARVAIACIAAGAAIGVGIAEWRTNRIQEYRQTEPRRVYLRMIDPTQAVAVADRSPP